MTELLEQAINRVRALPSDTQDVFARILLQMAGDQQSVYQLSEAEDRDLGQAEDEVERGDIAEESDVRAVLSKYGS